MNIIGLILIIEGFIVFVCAKGYLLFPNYENEIRFLTGIKKLGIYLMGVGILLSSLELI